MAFALEYSKVRHPLKSKMFYSDDPFRDLRLPEDKVEYFSRFRVTEINVGDIESNIATSTSRGRSGATFNGKDRTFRTIKLAFTARSRTHYGLSFLRGYIQHLFDTEEPFFFYEDWRPLEDKTIEQTVNGTKYKVMKDKIDISESGFQKLKVVVTMKTVELPYAISTGSTLDIINAGGLLFSTDKFDWGNWLSSEPETHNYRFKMVHGQKIRLYNPSLKKVKHFEACMHIKMSKFSNIKNTGLKLRNITNGSQLDLTINPLSTDVFEQRSNILWRNNLNELSKSDKKTFVELETGWNELIIEGADASVDYLFNFYY
ncbi:phage tail family protein [Macrococcoides canis]|uniref:phage tail family protein n=1 Tax=Macrococcoides canis TaxID=1855823 RepID=UPI001F2C4598|nr:phage tail family protein [Macrococcus canis]UJS28491.1 phage tail family protein [Macrococcus canis]